VVNVSVYEVQKEKVKTVPTTVMVFFGKFFVEPYVIQSARVDNCVSHFNLVVFSVSNNFA